MSMKQAIFDFIDIHPEISLDKVIENFSDSKKTTVKRYFYIYQKQTVEKSENLVGNKQAKSKKSAAVNLKKQVLQYLDNNPDSSVDGICEAFSGANRKTIGKYRYYWKKERGKKIDLLRIKQDVFRYLDQHPGKNINDLNKVFPNNEKKLITVFRNWKKRQTDRNKVPFDGKQQILSLNETIKVQRETIEKQRIRIKRLKIQLAKQSRFSLAGIKNFLREKIFR